MTKPRGVGRGGKRANAGRPPKQKAPTPAEFAADAVAAIETILAERPEPTLDELVKKAYRTLEEVMDGPTLLSPARVSAARAILAAATASAGASRGGKKGAQAQAAKAAGAGRFATPAAPRLVVDNK